MSAACGLGCNTPLFAAPRHTPPYTAGAHTQHSTLNTLHSTLNTQPSTLTQPSTRMPNAGQGEGGSGALSQKRDSAPARDRFRSYNTRLNRRLMTPRGQVKERVEALPPGPRPRVFGGAARHRRHKYSIPKRQTQVKERVAEALSANRETALSSLVSHKVFLKSFCRTPLPHKSINLSFAIT